MWLHKQKYTPSQSPTRAMEEASTPSIPVIASNAPSDAAARNYDVEIILAAMICALVCALGLNSMLYCIVRCTRRSVTEPVGWVASRRLNPGLKKEVVVALPTTTYTAAGPLASPSSCAICLADFSDGEKVRILPECGHRFHVGCIDKWLWAHCSCPTCRHRLTAAGGMETHLEISTAT